jgi:GNAT superfamily N-acetyltransferase
MIEKVKQILEMDPLRNVNQYRFLENYPLRDAMIIGNSVLIKAKSDRDWVMFSSNDEMELVQLLTFLNEDDKNFAFIEDWMYMIITAGKELKWELTCDQYYLPDEFEMPSIVSSVQSLKESDADFIIANSDYGQYLIEEYVVERIINGPSSCIRIDDKLAAWIHTHDDLALGSLHVMPEYRRKGFGLDLTVDMINKIRSLKIIPFTYIEPENDKSINLVTKLGFKKQKRISWFEVS